MARPSKYSPELRERAVRLVFDHAHEHPSQWAAIRSVAEKLGCTVDALRRWVRQAERDGGRRPGLTTDERQRLKQLEWRVCSSLVTDFVLDALEQAIYDRCDADTGDLVHHSDRGTQYLSMRYTDRLVDAGIQPSVGSRGDSYDNALAETIIGLFKTEVIRLKGPWRHLEAVEFATLDWVDWFNHRRLLEPIGYVPPVEYEARYYERPA